MNFSELTPERQALWQRLFGTTSPALMKTFKAYLAENAHVYRAFCDLARQARDAGRTKYSAWTIINVIRWNHDIATTGTDFKISNDHIALFARLLVWHDPTFEGFFDLKQMKPTRGSKMNTERKEAA